MTDSNALIGLLAALVTTIIAAYYGPRLLNERQAKRQVNEAEITRYQRMRSAGRAWLDVLERTVQDMQDRCPIDIERFDELVTPLSQQATEAGHALAHLDIWLESSGTPPHGIRIAESGPWRGPASYVPPDDPEAPEMVRFALLGRLRAATNSVRSEARRLNRAIESGNPDEVHQAVLEALDEVREARTYLNMSIHQRIRAIKKGRP